jgi:hypothetical protein
LAESNLVVASTDLPDFDDRPPTYKHYSKTHESFGIYGLPKQEASLYVNESCATIPARRLLRSIEERVTLIPMQQPICSLSLLSLSLPLLLALSLPVAVTLSLPTEWRLRSKHSTDRVAMNEKLFSIRPTVCGTGIHAAEYSIEEYRSRPPEADLPIKHQDTEKPHFQSVVSTNTSLRP